MSPRRPPSSEPHREIWRVPELAEWAGVDEKTARRWMTEGRIPGRKFNGCWWMWPEDVFDTFDPHRKRRRRRGR